MSFPAFAWRIVACGWWLTAACVVAKDPPSPVSPANPAGGSPPLLLHEIWVPANALDPILSRYPRAVSLGRDELLTLLHDAHAADPAATDPATTPPERAVLRQGRFDGRLVAGLEEGGTQVQVSAELEVEVFSDQWAEVPLGLRGVVLGTAEIDDGRPASLRQLPATVPLSGKTRKGSKPSAASVDTARPTALLLQGRGVHRLRLGFLLPVVTDANGSSLPLPTVAGVGEFTLHLPAGARADSNHGCAVQPDGAGVLARVSLNAAGGDRLTWRTPPPSPGAATAILQSGQMDVLVQASDVTIRQKVVLKAALGSLPAVVQVPLPSDTRAVQVEGAASWDVGTDGLRVTLNPLNQEDGGGVWFGVDYELPAVLDPSGAVTKIGVPLLEVAGAHRVGNRATVRTRPGVQVRRIEPGAIAVAVGGAGTAGLVAEYSLSDLPTPGNTAPPMALTLEARRAAARFSVDADARAQFGSDGVRLQRIVAFHVEEGEVFTARVVLPKGEEFLDLHPAGGSVKPKWRQEGDTLMLTWNAGLREDSRTVLTLDSRANFSPPKTDAPVDVSVAAALVPGAERLTGYVALSSTPALRLVTTGGEDRLERRDGRATPVTGDVAWFYRDDFHLALRVERRATETEARFTGYALPLAGAVEIHGQIDYRFLHAGVETVKIRVPVDAADAFFFTGAHIAERRRDGNVWTIRFQGDQTGNYALGVQATIPTPADKDDAERFHFRLPTVAPLDTARWSGVWAVEANTDTEISFQAVGASEVDTLHAPVLAGYQPRRRVIGVFEFLGNGAADAAVDLDGVRHPAAGVAAAVVDSLTLETFASTSGVSRHRATMRARTAGDGFFNIYLPYGASLWSLTRDGELIKPVGGAAGDLRVELPGGREPGAASTVVAIYETPGQPWASAGRRTLAAPHFDPGVPVVESHWTLHVPDGFDYRITDTSLTRVPAVRTGDLLLPQIGRAFGHGVQWVYYYPEYLQARNNSNNSGIADARPLASIVPAWMAAQLEKDRGHPSVVFALDMGPVPSEPVREFVLPTPTPSGTVQFIAPVEEVRRLFADAQGYYETGRYDLANKRYARVLELDPYNDAARKGQERVELARARHGDQPKGEMLVGRDNLAPDARRNIGRIRDEAGSASVSRKLESIIIPNIEFRSTALSDAIEFLRQESRRLDPDPDPEARGVNIFLKLPGGSAPAAQATTPIEPVIPGLPDAGGTTGTSPIVASSPSASTRITLTMSRLPLLEALRYVAQQAGLKVKVQQYAVSIVPLSETTDALVTQEFKMPPGLLGANTFTGATTLTAGTLNIQRQDAKTFLEASGVTFPPGASATYLPGQSKLVVRNTQENVDLIDSLTQEVGVPSAPASDHLVTIDGRQLTTNELLAAGTQKSLSDKNGLSTAEFTVPPQFLSSVGGVVNTGRDVTGVGSVTIQRQDAKSYLEAQGLNFAPGASATYLASSGKLVLRATPEAIRQMAGLLAGSRREKVAGLLPIRLDLPVNGLLYEFAGGGAPGMVDFHYADWRSAARWRWAFLTLGAVAFLLFAAGWAHPWRRTLWITLALTFWPLVVAPSMLTPCNALLAGWLWAVLGWSLTRFLLRRRRLIGAALLCAIALLPSLAQAAPAPTETVIVPYDATKPAATQQPARYYLPYERFLELWDAAKLHRRPAAPEPPPGGERSVLHTARYDARLVGETLEIDASLDLQTFGEGWVAVPLKFDGAQVGTLTLDGAPAFLSHDGDLWVGAPGAHRVAASLRLPVGVLSAKRDLSWSVPPTAATLVSLLLSRTDVRAEIHGNAGGGTVEETAPEGRRYLTSAGGSTTITLSFHDTPPPVPGTGKPALARTITRLTASARQETVSSVIELSFPGRTQNHFTVYLDPSLKLTNLDVPDIKEWHLATGGDRQTLDLTLNLPARDGYKLSLEADRPLLPGAMQRRKFPQVSAQAGRVEHTAALLTDGTLEIQLPDGPPAGTRRTPFALPTGNGRVFGAFASDGSPVLVYSVDVRAEKRTAHIDYLYQIGRGKIEWAASVRLTPGEGGAPIQTADLRLPPGVAVQAVAGGVVAQWWRDGDLLSLRFQAVQSGEVSLVVYLVQTLDPTLKQIALRPLVAEGFTEADGQSVVAADRAFKVGLVLPTGVRAHDLNEIDPRPAANEFQVKAPLERQRAFRYRGASFEVGATLELLPVLWQAHPVTRATVREGTVALETRVNVEVSQGALDALEFSLPAGLAEPGVSGPDVRETVPVPAGTAGQDRRTYRVLFQNPVYGGGEAALTLNLELPLGANGAALLPDLRFAGGLAASAFLLVENASAGEMTLEPHGLDPAIEKDVPFLPAQIVAGTRFFRVTTGVPWALKIAMADLEKTAGRAALVAYAELTSTLRADGEEWHRATYRLQNRRLQFLPVELPAGAELIGARVAGESVRVDAVGNPGREGPRSILVPLLKTRPGELSYDVELVYRRAALNSGSREQRTWGHWQMDDPRLPGIPVEKTLWDVYLPTDTRLLSSGGNLEPVVAALNVTEKLESALSDLRNLSATYQSAGATRQEQQLALSNFNSLAADVKAKAYSGPLGLAAGPKPSSAFFKQLNAASQSDVVNRKQSSIRRELDLLSTANAAAQQGTAAGGSFSGQAFSGSRSRSYDVNGGVSSANQGSVQDQRAQSPAFDFQGSIDYGRPIQTTDDRWRDNRALTLDQNRSGASVPQRPATPAVAEAKKGQLALNDSIMVDLPRVQSKLGEAGKDRRTVAADTGAVGGEERLSTARAKVSMDDEKPDSLPVSQSRSEPNIPPSLPAAAASNAPAPPPAARTESLRSVGRISLAVNFPLEGQLYHFKKLKSDARLTLWSVRPAAFERLGWLLVLTVLIASGGLIRWVARKWSARRLTISF